MAPSGVCLGGNSFFIAGAELATASRVLLGGSCHRRRRSIGQARGIRRIGPSLLLRRIRQYRRIPRRPRRARLRDMQWLIVTSLVSPFGKGCRLRGEVPHDLGIHSVCDSVTSLFEATSRTKKADVWECLWAFRHIGYSLTGLPALPDYPLVSRPKCFIYGDVTHPTRVLHLLQW